MTLAGHGPRDVVHDLVAGVDPFDEHEERDKQATLRWIRSGAPLFRTAPPATPDKHLCVYIALFDEARRTLLLVDHVKAGLWLLPGGHVDDGEDPRATVLREASEELRVNGRFHPQFGDQPLFLSVTRTRDHSHTDVSFWFVLTAEQEMRIEADPREANGVRWFALDDDPTEWVPEQFDPHMARFCDKLMARLSDLALVGK